MKYLPLLFVDKASKKLNNGSVTFMELSYTTLMVLNLEE